MKKTLEIFKLIIYYILLFVFSSISYNLMPIGAIAMIGVIYASGGILAPAIILSAISTSVFIGIKSLLIFCVFLILFLIPVIFIRPLVSIEGRNEKRKIANYLLLASCISFFPFGFLQGIYAFLLTYTLYKISVNTMAVLKNDDEKLVFSKEEKIGLFIFLSVMILYISSYFNLPLILPILLIFSILGFASIKQGIIETLLTYIFTICIFNFILIPSLQLDFTFNIDYNFSSVFLYTLPLIVFSLISLLRRFNRTIIYYSIAILNVILFFIYFKYFQNLIYYLPYILMSFTIIIFADDYENIKAKKIKDSNLISDEGETRLETPIHVSVKTKEEEILQDDKEANEKNKEKLKSREVIELFTDKDIFVNRMYVNEDIFKDLSLYNEIKSSDYIFEEIYDLIKVEGYINRKKFNNILLNNNIIIDIYNYDMEEEIRILEILALRELKRVIREKEEKKVLAERVEALQNDKKTNRSVEEIDSIEYNKELRSSSKKESIKDIFKKKK